MARKNAAIESFGIPTVGLTLSYFEFDFRTSARAVGLTEIRQVLVPFAGTGLTEQQARDMVDDCVMGEIIAALTTPLEQEHEPGVVAGKIPSGGEMAYPVPWEPYIIELGPLYD